MAGFLSGHQGKIHFLPFAASRMLTFLGPFPALSKLAMCSTCLSSPVTASFIGTLTSLLPLVKDLCDYTGPTWVVSLTHDQQLWFHLQLNWPLSCHPRHSWVLEIRVDVSSREGTSFCLLQVLNVNKARAEKLISVTHLQTYGYTHTSHTHTGRQTHMMDILTGQNTDPQL